MILGKNRLWRVIVAVVRIGLDAAAAEDLPDYPHPHLTAIIIFITIIMLELRIMTIYLHVNVHDVPIHPQTLHRPQQQ
jgi:hypothetical protein